MENGSFQTPFSDVAHLDFREELPPTPEQAPAPARMARTPSARPTTSSTVEALLSQNEDLMARLKVTLRRLTALEAENDTLKDIEHEVRTENASLTDQLLIWKEKESYWHKKNQTLENDMNAIRARFPELEQMEEKIERYKKYHEKIRVQVKPYIQQLKAYAQNLTLEIRKLMTEIESKEAKRLDVERRLRDLRADMDEQYRRQDQQSRELVALFEDEKSRLQLELTELRKINMALEGKADKLDQALMRQDELENVIIALNRSQEEAKEAYKKGITDREIEFETLKRDLTEERYKNKGLDSKLQAIVQESDRQKHRADQLQEQLSSLRYLWTNKCEETEKLQLTLQSLEKLNQELSAKLNQLRKGEATL
ncbi:MAG: hypothetical protein KF681_14030 [Bdellovibrionaceae bacterium]|nr:hypothetical protein [Pseudobdellovibrionaceae bacterium]